MKYKLTETSTLKCSQSWRDAIFKDSGDTYNGEIRYAKDGTEPPYLWWSGAGQTLSDLTLGGCYCVVDDGSQGADFSGVYIPNGSHLDPPFGSTSYPDYQHIDGGSRWLKEVVPSTGQYWKLTNGTVTLTSNVLCSPACSLPYQGHYGPGSSSWLQAVSAIIARVIPANTWIVSDYPDRTSLAAAWDSALCGGGPFFVTGSPTPPGSYGGNTNCSGGWCAFTLAEYHYPSPSCYRVADVASDPPSVSMAGDYTIGSPPVYYPADDEDRAVFNGPGNILRYENGAWRIGPATGDDCCYVSYLTTQRTPIVGLYAGIDFPDPAGTYIGSHRVVLCGNGQGWYPWCCMPCPPVPCNCVVLAGYQANCATLLRVTISGLSCPDLNGTFVLTWERNYISPDYPVGYPFTPGMGHICEWEYRPDPPISGYDSLRVWLAHHPVLAQQGICRVRWDTSWGWDTSVDLFTIFEGFDAVEFTASGTPTCNHSSSTCFVQRIN